MNGFWDHKTKPSTFVVADKGKEIYRGPFQEGYKFMKLDIPFANEVCEFTKIDRTTFLTSTEMRIEEQFGKIIKKFPILHHGWDGDGYGYIVTDGQENKIILTNHSKPYEADVSELRQKVIEYQQMIGETNSVIELLK